MTDSRRLREAIRARGLKINWIASRIGIAPWSFSRKMNNRTEFTSKEIQACSELLGLSGEERDRIFFAANVENLSTAEEA